MINKRVQISMLAFILAFLPLFGLAQNSPKTGSKTAAAKEFTITGKLTGIPDGTDVRLAKNGENQDLAKTKIVKGGFTIKGSVTEPTLCFIFIGQGKPVEIYVENAKIQLSSIKDQPGKYLVTGSKSHTEFKSFVDTFLPIVQRLSTYATNINMQPLGPVRDSLMNLYNQVHAQMQNEIDSFINNKPRSVVSSFILNITSQFYDDVVKLENRFNVLDEKVKKSETGKQVAYLIADKKIGAVGTEALDFSQPDTTGQLVKLSSFRGKYVLVDFWASWCGPCRVENPNVVQNFKRFKDKNFTVLGVSLDRPGHKDKWIQAIQEDSLTWTHVSDLQFWSNAAAQLYKINAIPQNLLVNPDGKIIAKNLRGPDLEAKLCELLGCN